MIKVIKVMSPDSFDYISVFLVLLFTIALFPLIISKFSHFGRNVSNNYGARFRIMNPKGRLLYAILATAMLAIVIIMNLDVLYFFKLQLGYL